MKRFLAILLLITLIGMLAACSPPASESVDTLPPREAPEATTEEAVVFADPVLEAMVRASMGRPEGGITAAEAEAVTTLWTRGIEQVVVRASIHTGRTTLPLYQAAEGEDEFVVGEAYTFGGRRIRISHIKLRDGPVIRKEGWKTVARRVKRIYGYLDGRYQRRP